MPIEVCFVKKIMIINVIQYISNIYSAIKYYDALMVTGCINITVSTKVVILKTCVAPPI